MNKLMQQLAGGDRRSIGRSNAVVGKVLKEPGRFAEIIDGMTHSDLLIRMRCADVAEKVSARHPEWLQCYKRRLLGLAASATEQELRWHLAQMLPRLDFGRCDRGVGGIEVGDHDGACGVDRASCYPGRIGVANRKAR